MRQTLAQVDAEVAELKRMRPLVREFTLFNESNHEAIEAQIIALSRRFDEDEIYNEWGEDGEDENDRMLEHALDAMKWRIGEEGEKPSDQWRELAIG